MTDMEQINRATWRKPLSLREYKRLTGHISAGEAASFDMAFAELERPRILDIGVGAGRTAGLLAGRGSSYLGVDYTSEMVALARAHHPAVRFELMDARDLSALGSGGFDLVVFSYNGIDSVDGAGRAAVMAEVARVLRPGGLFVFSSFHRGWRGFDEPLPYGARLLWTANPVKLGLRLMRYGYGYGGASLRRMRYQKLEERTGEHARLLHSAHDFGILIYATTPEQIDRQLAAAGFQRDPVLVSAEGQILHPSDDLSNEEHFNIVARKTRAQ